MRDFLLSRAAHWGGVAGELEDLSGHVLEDGGEVHRGASADAARVPAVADVAVHAPIAAQP
jgi:hypothetical protein